MSIRHLAKYAKAKKPAKHLRKKLSKKAMLGLVRYKNKIILLKQAGII